MTDLHKVVISQDAANKQNCLSVTSHLDRWRSKQFPVAIIDAWSKNKAKQQEFKLLREIKSTSTLLESWLEFALQESEILAENMSKVCVACNSKVRILFCFVEQYI